MIRNRTLLGWWEQGRAQGLAGKPMMPTGVVASWNPSSVQIRDAMWSAGHSVGRTDHIVQFRERPAR